MNLFKKCEWLIGAREPISCGRRAQRAEWHLSRFRIPRRRTLCLHHFDELRRIREKAKTHHLNIAGEMTEGIHAEAPTS